MEEKRAVIILRPGEEAEIRECDSEVGLSELQEICGGNIEVCATALSDDWTDDDEGTPVLAVNEEGKIWGMEVNDAATDMLSGLYADVICGPAVVLAAKGEELAALRMETAQRIAEEWCE